MTSYLVTYGTGGGQTAKVADHVGSVLKSRGREVTTIDVWRASNISIEEFDAVLIGSSVNYNRHRPEVTEFVERNRNLISDRPTAFFQLSFAAAVPSRWAQEGAMDLVEDMSEETGWHPDRVGLFAGAVTYTRYDPVTRLLFKLVSMVTTGDTDTSRDYQYTDWDAVERFAVEFDEFVQARRERAPSPSGALGRAVPGRGSRRVALGLLGIGLAGVGYWLLSGRGRRAAVPMGRAEPQSGDHDERRVHPA